MVLLIASFIILALSIAVLKYMEDEQDRNALDTILGHSGPARHRTGPEDDDKGSQGLSTLLDGRIRLVR